MTSDKNFGGEPPSQQTTLFRRCVTHWIERIGKGDWKPGMAIPNEVDLAREFGISSGTMRKALDLLETERVLSRKQGRGTFVNDHSSISLASGDFGGSVLSPTERR